MMHNAMAMTTTEHQVGAPSGTQQNVPLAPLTTLGIGGPAKYFIRAENVDEVRDAVAWASAKREQLLVLAGGSNVLIADAGFDGVVLQIALRGVHEESEDAETVMVKVAAGETWDDFVALAVRNRWAGVECLSGIPGSTGATPIQNVGAYGQDVSETIVRVEALDRVNGRVTWFTNWDCGFGYRSSAFKSHERERYIILSVTFRLRRNGAAAVRYPELRQFIEERGASLQDLQPVRDAVIAIRRRKGMVIDPADPDTRSDGSFFMNPIISRPEFETLAARVGDKKIPNFPSGDEVKLSAAWLIENAGFRKGLVHGNVGLSSKHSLAIINRGGGTAREVVELVRMIQQKVRETFGVEIHPEPNLVGVS
jgi:UDP-N-acetylmuramate dehydrogenase